MRSVIRQSVVLPATSERLFQMYLSSEQHSAFTGQPATVGADAGAPFSAFDGALHGHLLETVAPMLIVQSWRSVSFQENDSDSTLILQFHDVAEGGQIDLIHLDVPEHDREGVTNGWNKFYWTPWRAYLEANPPS